MKVRNKIDDRSKTLKRHLDMSQVSPASQLESQILQRLLFIIQRLHGNFRVNRSTLFLFLPSRPPGSVPLTCVFAGALSLILTLKGAQAPPIIRR